MGLDDIELSHLQLDGAEPLLDEGELIFDRLAHDMNVLCVLAVMGHRGQSGEPGLELASLSHQRVELGLELLDVLDLSVRSEREKACATKNTMRRRC